MLLKAALSSDSLMVPEYSIFTEGVPELFDWIVVTGILLPLLAQLVIKSNKTIQLRAVFKINFFMTFNFKIFTLTLTKIEKMKQNIIHSDPDILGGTPVFRGTRTPIQVLFDYLRSSSLDDFLRGYPHISREMVNEVLQLAEKKLTYLGKRKLTHENIA